MGHRRLLLVLSLWSCCHASADTLQPLKTYAFQAAESTALTFAADNIGSSKTLPGTSCQTASSDDALGMFGLGLQLYGSETPRCWTDGRYNNLNFLVEQSTVGNYTAYRIHPPSSTYSQFLASQTHIYFKWPSAEAFTAYVLQDGMLVTAAKATSTSAGQFIHTGIRVDNLQAAAVYVFLPDSATAPLPSERTIRGTEASVCDTSGIDVASIGSVALVLKRGGTQNLCWSDGRYNDLDFRVERGTLTGSDGSAFEAYKFHPPTTQATQFLVSKVAIYFRPAAQEDLVVSSYDGRVVLNKGTMPSSGLTAGTFSDTGIEANSFTEATILVIHPASQRFSHLRAISNTVDGALLSGDGSFSVSARRFDVSGHAFIPGDDWGHGPGTHQGNYAIPRKFFPVDRADGREGVVWQDQTSKTIYMTWFSSDLTSADTAAIYSGSEHLVAAASNGQDALALLLVASGSPSAKTASSIVKALKASATPAQSLLVDRTLDTSKSGLDVHEFHNSGASMAWNVAAGRIGVVLARTMTQASDGLNHQGAIGFVLNAATMELIINHGQTSGHSFGNSLGVMSDGNFLSLDLGDNYPRGLNLLRFNDQSTSKEGFVVYNFKTKHGTVAQSPAGTTYSEYTEISSGGTTYYKWSNDNYVYTELGYPGTVEVDDGVLVFFAGESPPLDNSRVGSILNSPRNVGFVKVGKDLASKNILSSGTTETGGFYTFGGSWSSQTNEGVNFLTSWTTTAESASRLKTARLNSTTVLLYWELWTADSGKEAYRQTQLMLVDSDGVVLQGPWTSDAAVRLPRQDDPRVKGGRAVAYAGATGKLVRYEFCGGGDCGNVSQTGTTATFATTATARATSTSVSTSTSTPTSTSSSLSAAGMDQDVTVDVTTTPEQPRGSASLAKRNLGVMWAPLVLAGVLALHM